MSNRKEDLPESLIKAFLKPFWDPVFSMLLLIFSASNLYINTADKYPLSHSLSQALWIACAFMTGWNIGQDRGDEEDTTHFNGDSADPPEGR